MFPTFYLGGGAVNLALTITNPGFETAPYGSYVVPAGWTNNNVGSNNPYAADTTGLGWPGGGTRCLIGGILGDGTMSVQQDLDLTLPPNYISPSLIDSGRVRSTFSSWMGCLEKGGNDQPKMSLLFLTAGGAEISSVSTGYVTPTTIYGTFKWDYYTLGPTTLPATTRKLRILLEGNLAGGGSGSDGSWDDLAITLSTV